MAKGLTSALMRKITFTLMSSCLLLCAFPHMSAGVTKEDAATTKMIDRAMKRVFPSLVRIDVVMEQAQSGRMEKRVGAGSGAIIDKEGHIITNHHVAGKARRLVCRMPDGEEIEADLIGTDPLGDIAVLKLDLSKRKKQKPLPVAEFGDSDRVVVGDTVLAMGCPGGMSQSVTKGIVANTAMMLPRMMGEMNLDGENVGSLVRWLGHDAQIFGGNSGGPLVNLSGEIIGINEVGVAGLGGAIPGNLARSIARQIIEKSSVSRSWTGIEAQPRLKSSSQDRGVLVSGIINDSPASEAGLKAGDVILEFDGVPVNCRIDAELPLFNALQLSTPVGKKIRVAALRDGKEQKFEFTTRVREPAVGLDQELKEWGVTARDLTLMSALELMRKSTDGVMITSVQTGGPAAAAEPELCQRDVLVEVESRPVKNLAELAQITAELTKGITKPRPVLAAFERGQSRFLTVVKIGGEQPKNDPVISRKPEFPVILQPVNPDLAEALGIKGKPGVRIAYVVPNRSAARAGFKAGDIISAFDGDAVRADRDEDVSLFMQQIKRYKIGKEVVFDILRETKPVQIKMKLEESADTAEEPKSYENKDFEMGVRELTSSDRIRRQIPDTLQGVLVNRVEPAGWAMLARVVPEDILITIDGKPVPDVDTAEKLLKDASARKATQVVLFVQRGIHTMFLEIEPNWNGKKK